MNMISIDTHTMYFNFIIVDFVENREILVKKKKNLLCSCFLIVIIT